MTALSCLTLGIGASLAGCATTLAVAPEKTPALVAAYSPCHEGVIVYDNARYAVNEKQAPELSVRARAGASELPLNGPDAPDQVPLRRYTAPLGAIRSQGYVLRFPNAPPIEASEIEEAELRLSGEALAPIRIGDQGPTVVPLSERNDFLGAQLGGSSVFQVIYRRRIWGPFLAEVGGMVVGPEGGLDASAGLIVDVSVWHRWSTYVGAGAGLLSASTSLSYLYGRVGIAVRLGVEQRDQIGLDGGAWSGTLERDRDDPKASESTRHFFWPMAGLSLLRAL